MKKLLIIGAALLIIVPLGLWWFSSDQVIKRRSEHLMDVLTISADTSGAFRQAKVFSINGILDAQVVIETPDVAKANGTFEKQEIESAFSWICRNAKESRFQIEEFQEVKIEGDRAMVRAKVEGFMELSSGRPLDGVFYVTLHWVKRDGGWRLKQMAWQPL